MEREGEEDWKRRHGECYEESVIGGRWIGCGW